MLELMVGTVERLTLLEELSPGVNVAFTAKDCVREIFTVRVGNRTTELVFSDTDGNTRVVKETFIARVELTEAVDDMLTCGVGVEVS